MNEQVQLNMLDNVKTHNADLKWISEQEDDLYNVFSEAIHDGVHTPELIEGLLQVFPYIFTEGKLKQWVKLLHDVGLLLDENSAEETKSQSLVQAYFRDIAPPEHAHRMIKTALRRARKRIDPNLMLQLYLNLFKSQIYYQDLGFNEEIVFNALDLGRQINEQESYARLYLALAFAYNHWHMPLKALDFGRLAQAYWAKKRNDEEHALSTYVLAVAYRVTDEFDEARKWLAETSKQLAKTKNERQYAVITAETGALYLQEQKYAEGESWTVKALQEYLAIDDIHSASIAHQAIATCQANLGKFDEAHDHLSQALTYWEEHDNIYQQQQVYHSRAYVEYMRADKKQALAYLEKSRELANQLPNDNNFRAGRIELLDNLEELINEL